MFKHSHFFNIGALVQFRHNTPKQKERKNKTKQNNVDDGFCFFFFLGGGGGGGGGGLPKKKAETIIHRIELQEEAQYTANLTAELSKSSQWNINKSKTHRTCKQPAQTAKTHTHTHRAKCVKTKTKAYYKRYNATDDLQWERQSDRAHKTQLHKLTSIHWL